MDIGDDSPSFNGTTVEGTVFESSSARGNVFVVQFLYFGYPPPGPGYPPREESLDAIHNLTETMRSRGVKFVTIVDGTSPDPNATLADYVRGLYAPTTNWDIIEDQNRRLFELFQVNGSDSVYVFDNDGPLQVIGHSSEECLGESIVLLDEDRFKAQYGENGLTCG